MSEVKNQYEMRDPISQYPKPPFPPQPQERPGSVNKMEPEPDHGEESYVGFGRLKDRKALITGGDSGIGRAAAIAYAREGADVAINYLPSEEKNAQEVAKLIRAENRKAILVPGDIVDEAFCKKMVQQVADELGSLDILVNNAGRQTSQESIFDISTEQFDNTMKVNLYAMFWITKAALPFMPKGATIINTTSVVSYMTPENLLDYSMTKSAIVSFTKALSKQVAKEGIRVNAIAPGPFWTPLQPSGGQPQKMITQFGSMAPMGRPGQPAEIAPIYVLLASQESSYMTGEVVGVAGGMTPF